MTAAHSGAHGVPEWSRGDRMRKALSVAGISVGEMADYLEVNRNTVGNWINDHFAPNAAVLRIWAMRCGVPYEWLRTGEVCAVRDSNPEPAD